MSGEASGEQSIYPSRLVDDVQFQYKSLRDEITYESSLIAQRTAWFVAAQAFLFTATGVTIDRSHDAAFMLSSSLLWPYIPFVGMAICILSFLAVVAAVESARRSRNQLSALINNNQQQLTSAWTPRPTWVRWFGMAPSLIIPGLFLATWVTLLVRELCK